MDSCLYSKTGRTATNWPVPGSAVRGLTLSSFFVWAAVLMCLFIGYGCSEPAMPRRPVKSVNEQPLTEFDKHTDPAPTPKTLYAMASILAAQGKDRQCEVLLRRILKENPRFTPVYNSLAELQMRNRRINEAMDTIQRGLELRPNDTVLWNNLGMCWMIRGNYEKALEMFTKAAGLSPENTRYRANMAVALGLMGRNEESRAIFEQILPADQAERNVNIVQQATSQIQINPSDDANSQ